MHINTLSLDYETYSSNDLLKCGVYKYTEAPDFEVLLMSYSINSGPVEVIDLASGEDIPANILKALTDENVPKWAHNAGFERICTSKLLKNKYPEYFKSYSDPDDTVGNYISPKGWYCSLVLSAYNGLPLSLAGVGKILGFDEQKMLEGKDLIRYFCSPCKPTKANGGRTRNLPSDAPDKWAIFVEYNRRDTVVEEQILERLSKYPVPDKVWEEYWLSEQINDRGILIDLTLVHNAIDMDERSKAELEGALKQITNLANPNSVSQLKEWLASNGLVVESLGKKQVADLITTAPGKLREVLELRQMSAKSSVKKYEAMINAVCRDGRLRGMFMFYGASRSGRYSGRIVQLQNLPRPEIPDVDVARTLVKANDYDMVKLLYDSIPSVLSALIRTTFIPKSGYKFIVADFSAIECRTEAWLAGEQWVLDAFARGDDIYCSMAEKMFHVKVEKHGENKDLRQRGKQAVLSCGYQGSVGALKAMGAVDMGIPEEELDSIVAAYREANPNIVKLWYAAENAAKKAIMNKTTTETNGVKFICRNGMLFVELPSGRHLSYVKPRMGVNQFGSPAITYEGTNGTSKKWDRIETFGGKICENLTQALARDLLLESMKSLSGYRIVAHIHDEVIIEAPMDASLDDVCNLMAKVPDWAPGLVLKADGFESMYYKKD